MDRFDFRNLAQLKAVPVQFGTTSFGPQKPTQTFDFIDLFHFGTSMHKIIRLYSHMHAHAHTQCKLRLKCRFFRCQPVPEVFKPNAINLLPVVLYGCNMNAWNTKTGSHCPGLRITRSLTLAESAGSLQAREPVQCEKLTQRLIVVGGLFLTQDQKTKHDNLKFIKRSCLLLLASVQSVLKLRILMATKKTINF